MNLPRSVFKYQSLVHLANRQHPSEVVKTPTDLNTEASWNQGVSKADHKLLFQICRK